MGVGKDTVTASSAAASSSYTWRTLVSDNRYAAEVIAGSLGGASGVIVGHPLDLLKVNQQNHRHSISATALFFRLVNENPLQLFRGLMPPVVNGVVYQAIMFPGYRLGLSLLGKPAERQETLFESSVAGTFAGLLTTIGTSPLEVAKIKLQLDPESGAGTKGATTRQLWKLFKTRELYSGWTALAWRDGPGTGVYMASYYWLKHRGLQYSSSSELVELLSGGFAGVLCWLSILPFDTVKTRLQFDAGAAQPKYKYSGLMDGLTSIIRREGVSALFLGWKPLCARAFPVNAVTFFVYERAIRAFAPPTPVAMTT